MNLNYKIILTLGILWMVHPVDAQHADSPSGLPADVRTGPPPKRGAPPTRMENNDDPTLNKGKVEWLPRHVDFGALNQGTPQVKEMIVKNVSKQPLKILHVKSSCHCTTASWPKEDIQPGKTAKILVMHNAEDLGDFLRILSIQTNFDLENWVMVSVTGVVKAH
jgi:hypothetical protein